MPKITRQRANDKTPSKTGSVLDEAIPVEDLEDDFIKMVIYGINRVGKTTLACKFPKPLLLVGMEPTKTGGALSVRNVPGVKYVRVASTEKAGLLCQELANGAVCDLPKYDGQPYATVVIDSITSYQDIVLKELLGLEAVPEQLNWGLVSRDQYRERSEKIRECLRPWVDLPCHTVFTAKEKDHNPPDKDQPKILRGSGFESFFAADLGAAAVGWLHDACDYIARLYIEKETKKVKKVVKVLGKTKEKWEEVETGRTVRRLRTMLHPNFAAGIRSCDPETVPEYIEEPTWEKIKAVIDGKRLEKE